VALLCLAAHAPAREVTLILKDGRKLTGEMVVESAESVTVRIAGIETTYPRAQISDLQVRLTIAEQFRQQRAAIADTNVAARYDLARDFYDKAAQLAQEPAGAAQAMEAYQLALKELEAILQTNPGMQQAQLLRGVVQDRIKSLQLPQPPAPDSPANPGTPGTPSTPTNPTSPTAPTTKPQPDAPQPPAPVAPGSVRLLTPDEIKLIRIFEINLKNKPAVRLPPDVVDKLFKNDAYRQAPEMQPYIGRDGLAKFRNLEGYQQLQILFDLRARELYQDVIINSEPQSMRDFRTKINQNYLTRYCGSCHGEGRANGLYLITRPSNDQTLYTNYMIIRNTPAKRPLLFFDRPDESLLLQYGLPAREAISPHPEVRGTMVWRPYFTGKNDPRFTDSVDWIKSLWSDEYPVTYVPPIVGPPPAPAQPPAGPDQNPPGAPAPAPAPAPNPQ
jgi:hypothetical protein